jgi:hypothetical protein
MPVLAYLPMSNKSVAIGTRKYMRGRGMGSVLLNRGGAGGASAYESVGDYTATTGVDPYARPSSVSTTGRGLGQLNKKLEELAIKPRKRKEKNINFNL